VRARHPLTRAPSTCDVGVVVSLRSDAVVVYSYVHNNAGLCGPLVSVGTVGTNYNCFWNNNVNGCDGVQGTNLGTACSSRLDDQLPYLACVTDPATCVSLCAPYPPGGFLHPLCGSLYSLSGCPSATYHCCSLMLVKVNEVGTRH
jgi:hypothetical protein